MPPCNVHLQQDPHLPWDGWYKHSLVVWWRHLDDVHCIIDASMRSHTIYVFCCLLSNAAEPLCSHANSLKPEGQCLSDWQKFGHSDCTAACSALCVLSRDCGRPGHIHQCWKAKSSSLIPLETFKVFNKPKVEPVCLLAIYFVTLKDCSEDRQQVINDIMKRI